MKPAGGGATCRGVPSGLWSAALLGLRALDGHSATSPQMDEKSLPPPAEVRVDFARDIKPLLKDRCYKCHAGDRPKSDFRLTSRAAALKGGTQGVAIVPGQSGKSPLIYYAARLVEGMEMPPEGRGTPLISNEVALLRAWIDQGLNWEPDPTEESLRLNFDLSVGGTAVRGDRSKFREVTKTPAGWSGGMEEFDIENRPDPDTKFSVAGHVLRDDYRLTLSLERHQVGFARFGWSQFRTYYDDTGGYDPRFLPAPFDLDRDLRLDTGRAWVDFGLARPHWPRVELGYEYQYRRGEKSTLQWGPVNNGADLRNVYPAAKDISEDVHILKFKAEYEVAGLRLSDSFRGEWHQLQTERLSDSSHVAGTGSFALTKVEEQESYFHGANVFHAEKQFTDWLFAGGGYLYSKLTSDASMDVQTLNAAALDPSLAVPGWRAPSIEVERESSVFSLSSLLGPWQALSLSLGVQNEWSRQEGLGNAAVDITVPFPPFLVALEPQRLSSSLDRAVFTQDGGLRFTGIPCTTLFTEARFHQEKVGLYQEEVGGLTPFLLEADETTRLHDLRAGFATSPWRRVELSAEYRRSDKRSDYDNSRQEVAGLPFNGYPGLMRSHEVQSDRAQGRMALSLSSRLKTALAYHWIDTRYRTATEALDDPVSGMPGGITTGENSLAGTYQAHVPSINVTLTPARRLFLSATFAFQRARTTTAENDSPAIVPFQGNVYNLLASGSYALDPKTDLAAGYSFSAADFAEEQPEDGLPLGIEYRQHSIQVGIKRQLRSNLVAGLQYRYYRYDEPSSGGANDFEAHAVFATLAWKLP